MSEPKIAALKPVALELEAGKEYWWCRCGRSDSQPFCDGSHEGSGFEPMCFTVVQTRKKALCQCKHTQTPPFCDGSHKALREKDPGRD